MRVAVDMGAASDTAASAAEATQVSAGADAQVSVAALAPAELVEATMELESAEELVPTPRESTTHHEHRSADRIIVHL